MGVHTALESWQIIPIWKTIGWKTVPLICRANKEPRWPGNSPALRNLDTERVQRIDTTGGARSNKCWKHRCMEAIRTSAKVISVEQTQGSNIPSVRQRFKSAVQSWANKLFHSMLDPIYPRERGETLVHLTTSDNNTPWLVWSWICRGEDTLLELGTFWIGTGCQCAVRLSY